MDKKKYLPGLRDDWIPQDAFYSKKNLSYFTWHDITGLILLAVVIFWVWHRAEKLPGYAWNWELLGEFIVRRNQEGSFEAGLLLLGLFTTLRVGFWSFFFAFFVGGILGVIYSGKRGFAALPYRIFVNIIRNTPPLVALFCVYFFAGNFLPLARLEEFVGSLPEILRDVCALIYAKSGQMDRMTAAVLALGIYQSAYLAEIVRGGVESVGNNQWDAGLALGFSRSQVMRHIILPQARKIIIPPLTGQAISSFKDSALASLISLPDLTFQSLEIMAVSNMTFEVWTSCAILYLMLGCISAFIGRYLEKSSI